MIVGIIFGPVGANIFNPYTWGNTDYITLEVARIVIVVQVFAVGVELPKKYLKNHWKGVAVMLLPVMICSWFICAAIIYGLIPKLNFVESLVIAATLAPTDPVLASSVVGKGKFAERVPGHIRNLLSCESGCNDGMAFPFLYIGLYIILDVDVTKTAKEWILITILYECIFGTLLGILIGYSARRAIRIAEDRKFIDRESFLVFYFVLALFCTGIGTVLGVDDFLVAFSAGATFAWDGWFSKKTEESHVSNVIDLLLNMAFFVYFGSVIPWSEFNAPNLSITPWRLVVISILILLFRRIPVVFACYKICPDIRNPREALFCGHFGPIGVGALFFAILARAELETESQIPLTKLPDSGEEYGLLINAIYPIVAFVVLSSIVVHGSSVAVFTLGKHVHTNVLPSISMTFTRNRDDEDAGPNWLQRLPRLEMGQSMTFSKSRDRSRDRSTSRGASGGVIDQSAIGRATAPETARTRHRGRRPAQSSGHADHDFTEKDTEETHPNDSDATDERSQEEIDAARQHAAEGHIDPDDAHYHEDGQQVFREGDQFIVEDELGEVIRVVSDPRKLSHAAAHNLLDKEDRFDDMSKQDREEIVQNSDHPLFPKLKSFMNGLTKTHEQNFKAREGQRTSSRDSSSEDRTLTNNSSPDMGQDFEERSATAKDRRSSRRDEVRRPDDSSSTQQQSEKYASNDQETAAERKRRMHALGRRPQQTGADSANYADDTETPAERRRRLQALGHSVETGANEASPVRAPPEGVAGVPSEERDNEAETERGPRLPRISFHSSVGEQPISRERTLQVPETAVTRSDRLNPINNSNSLPLTQSHSRGRSIVWADHSNNDRDLENGGGSGSAR